MYTDFRNIEIGQKFLHNGGTFIKTEENKAIRILSGKNGMTHNFWREICKIDM
jgi:hypothetical protein